MRIEGCTVVSCIPEGFRQALGRSEAYTERFFPDARFPIKHIDATKESLPSADDLANQIVIVGGSPNSANDDEPWIEQLGSLIRKLHYQKNPLLGVCFGHQLIARVLGGEVRRNSFGREFGYCRVFRTHHGFHSPLLHGLGRDFIVTESHQDVVWRLPPGALRLAWNPVTWVQAAEYGGKTFGVQFHPEARRDLLQGLADLRRRALIDEGFYTNHYGKIRHVVGEAAFAQYEAELKNDHAEQSSGSVIIANFVRHAFAPAA